MGTAAPKEPSLGQGRPLTRQGRQRIASEAEHNGEMAGLHISPQMRADTRGFVGGEIDADELVALTRARYGLT